MSQNTQTPIAGIAGIIGGALSLPVTGSDSWLVILPFISFTAGIIILTSFFVTRLLKKTL